MSLPSPRILFVPLVRSTFDVPFAESLIADARACLKANGFELVGPERAVSDLAAAKSTAAGFKDEPVDMLLIFQATFADSSLVVTLAESIEAPLFLWAVPEPWTGARLRLNSLCGINLAGHALTRRGRLYQYGYALPDDEEILRQIGLLARAGRLARQLKSARLGVVGEHPTGLDSCHLDEPTLRHKFGVDIRLIPLAEVFKRARAVSNPEVTSVRAQLEKRLDNLSTLEQKPLHSSLSVYVALREIAREMCLDGLAVRCWPEFFTELGCAACGPMSMLSDGLGLEKSIPCSCEADVNGTLTQLILSWISDSPAFGTDIVGMDFEKDTIALWHCGLAPLTMAGPQGRIRGGVHSNRGVPLVMDFPLKPGPVTIARISQASGQLKLVLMQGEMLAAPQPFSGASGVLRLERPAREFFDLLMSAGLEHHISLVYGNITAELNAFAHLLGLPILDFDRNYTV
jgi:L-fucose isomerase-like protein